MYTFYLTLHIFACTCTRKYYNLQLKHILHIQLAIVTAWRPSSVRWEKLSSFHFKIEEGWDIGKFWFDILYIIYEYLLFFFHKRKTNVANFWNNNQYFVTQVPLTEEDNLVWILQEAFIWGTLVTPIPGSRLAVNIGPKKQFGWATLGASLCSLLVPAAWNTPAHVMLRVIQGMLMVSMIFCLHILSWVSSLL